MVPFFPRRSCLSPLNSATEAFLISMMSPSEMVSAFSFHKQSFTLPVSSAIQALVTLELVPNCENTFFDS